MKHEPHPDTPLPWRFIDSEVILDAERTIVCRVPMPKDGKYIVHAANAYPKFISDYKAIIADIDAGVYGVKEIKEQLLTRLLELGEAN